MEVQVVPSSDVAGLVITDVKAYLPLSTSDSPALFPGWIMPVWAVDVCHRSLFASWRAWCKSAQTRGQDRGGASWRAGKRLTRGKWVFWPKVADAVIDAHN